MVSRYQASNCATCPMNGVCHKAKGNRIVEVNHRLNRLKARARRAHRRRRSNAQHNQTGGCRIDHRQPQAEQRLHPVSC
ncbi:MAG: transposase [Flavobacteriales bacterium]|nr:transposase [Flavobacteriales bacterium]